jgi:hypothetical protein
MSIPQRRRQSHGGPGPPWRAGIRHQIAVRGPARRNPASPGLRRVWLRRLGRDRESGRPSTRGRSHFRYAVSSTNAEHGLLDFIAYETAHVYQYRQGAVFSNTDLLKNAMMERFRDWRLYWRVARNAEAIPPSTSTASRMSSAMRRIQEGPARLLSFQRLDVLPRQAAGQSTVDIGYSISKRIAQAHYERPTSCRNLHLLIAKDLERLVPDGENMPR